MKTVILFLLTAISALAESVSRGYRPAPLSYQAPYVAPLPTATLEVLPPPPISQTPDFNKALEVLRAFELNYKSTYWTYFYVKDFPQYVTAFAIAKADLKTCQDLIDALVILSTNPPYKLSERLP